MSRRKYTYNCVNDIKPNQNCVICQRAVTGSKAETMTSYIKKGKEYICAGCDVKKSHGEMYSS